MVVVAMPAAAMAEATEADKIIPEVVVQTGGLITKQISSIILAHHIVEQS